MVNWKTVVTGLILALILSLVFGILGGSWGTTLGFFLAAIYTGYSAGGDYTNGAIHAGIMSIIYSIIYSGLLLIIGTTGDTTNLNPISLIILVFISTIIKGAIGGNIGVFIKCSNPKEDKIAA